MRSESGLVITEELPSLPEGWQWRSLRDLVDQSRGICYGIVQPGVHDPNGVPMVNSGDVLDGRTSLKIEFRVSTELHERFRRSTLRGGELLITLVGANFGRVAIAPDHYAGNNCARPVGVVPVIKDADFVMFAIRSPLGRRLMDAWANTTAQPTLNLRDLGNIPIPLPPPSERNSISTLLKSMDDRIELLREANVTLEFIAQALFKSWFIDFDPVRAKQRGLAPEGIDEATAALFPDRFEFSDFGPVPKGWLISTVSNVSSQLFSGGTPDTRRPEYWTGPHRWFSSGETRERVVVDTEKRISELAVRESSTRLAIAGDILVASAGQGHTRGQTSLCATDMYINQSVVCVRADSQKCQSEWLYFELSRRYSDMRDLSDSHSCGRRSKSEPPCRPNIEPGVEAGLELTGCG